MNGLPARINLVTLGSDDLPRAIAFYEALGFPRVNFDSDGVAFFQLDGTVLGVFGRTALAEDARLDGLPTPPGPMSVAINFASTGDVDAALAFAERCGARIVKPAETVFWGGYSGYFADPDGHLWEIAYNPHFPLDERGHFNLPTIGSETDAKT